MKEHSAEKEKAKAKTESTGGEEGDDTTKQALDDNTELTEQDRIENEWDAFMEKSIQPGEDDDEDEDDDDDDEDDDEEEEEGEGGNDDEEESGNVDTSSVMEDMTLAERCDKFMM